MKRFQESSKIIQILRYRWYIAIPFVFLYYKITSLKVFEDKIVDDKIEHTDNYFIPNNKAMWSLAKSRMQGKMKWYYTSEEVYENIKKKFNR